MSSTEKFIEDDSPLTLHGTEPSAGPIYTGVVKKTILLSKQSRQVHEIIKEVNEGVFALVSTLPPEKAQIDQIVQRANSIAGDPLTTQVVIPRTEDRG